MVVDYAEGIGRRSVVDCADCIQLIFLRNVAKGEAAVLGRKR
jgi:hypothetical protein